MAITLTADTGRITGSRSSTRLRDEGRVPAIVYGLGREAVSVSVSWPELRKALTTEAGTNALITLDVDGTKDLTIVKDLQRHPVRRNVLHIDFLRVDPDALVSVDVPINLVGIAREVEGRRGIVDQPLKTLAIKAKPTDIPSFLECDVTDLELGGAITVATLSLPAGVSTDVDPDTQVVLGLSTRFSIEADAEGEEAEGAEASADAAPAAEASDEAAAE